jgi:type I restriction enzyme R subunit
VREAILVARRSLEQVIDEANPDQLLSAGFSDQALLKARSMLSSFRQFIEDNRDEIEAIRILYSRPYRSGLRFRHVRELAYKLNQSDVQVDIDSPEPFARLWRAYELTEPQKVKARGGSRLVDVIALVKHALDPSSTLVPIGMSVAERYAEWLAEKERAGMKFTPEQRKWLDAIRDHIANNLAIERDDLDELPFNGFGGIGRAYEVFRDALDPMLDELNARLAA